MLLGTIVIRQTLSTVSYLYSLAYFNVLLHIMFMNKFFVSAAGNISSPAQVQISNTQSNQVTKSKITMQKNDNIFFEETRIES
jgi:hypothetical protein